MIASLILNLAFLSGFVIKKYIFPNQINKTVAEPKPNMCQMKPHSVGYKHLCQRNPGFKNTFHDYQTYYRHASDSLIKVKIEFLTQLKQEKPNGETLAQLLKEMNAQADELNEKNYRHLLSLKALLKPADFASLIDCMTSALGSYREMPFPVDKGDCMQNEN